MKLKITVHKTIEINLSGDAADALSETLLEKYNEGIDGGEEIKTLADADNAYLADVVKECYGDDSTIIDFDIDETDFTVEVVR